MAIRTKDVAVATCAPIAHCYCREERCCESDTCTHIEKVCCHCGARTPKLRPVEPWKESYPYTPSWGELPTTRTSGPTYGSYGR